MAPAQSVQQYIDEPPIWRDGTSLRTPPLTAMQFRIWALAAAGKMLEGIVLFMTGVALPLVGTKFALNHVEHGLVASATLFGILIGATALGGLVDTYGRKRMFVVEIVIFLAFLIGVSFSVNFPMFLVCLFGMGLALGCDYPVAHVVVSESIPSPIRGRMVLGAFAFQSVGAVLGTLIGFSVLAYDPSVEAWRWMYAIAIVPTAIVIVLRLTIPESPHFLALRGRMADAEWALARQLGRTPPYPPEIRLKASDRPTEEKKAGYLSLFSPKYRRATILASVPWFLQDLGTFGIGVFTPVILAASFGHEKKHATAVVDIVHNEILAAKGAAMVDTLLLVGVLAAVLLSDTVGRIKLQIIGFVGCAVGLAIAALSGTFVGAANIVLIFAGFMVFNFMTAMGPNAQTYLIAGEVFPVESRGIGAGFAASFGKVGAVLTTFLFPILLVAIGTDALLMILVGMSLLGAAVTWLFRIETAGRNLETIRY